MPNNLDQYTAQATDWRKTIRQNNFRTYIVIGLFFLIYCSIGLLVDISFSSGTYPEATIGQLFFGLITFQIFPTVTVVMFCISAIALWISYALYDKIMLLGTEYHEITPQTAQTPEERQLYNVIEELKIAAGLRYMPKVFIIDADYMNAFASGYSEKSAMVAITRGLMQKLNRDELQAVMAHELSHIRHLDIKLTLTASLLANMALMVLDFIFYRAMFNGGRNSRSRSSILIILFILRYTLPLITVLLLLYLSRTRELSADAGSVELTRNNIPLANALIKIQGDHLANKETYAALYAKTPHENVRREAYIFDPQEAGMAMFSISDLFSTHPSLETRLAAMGFKRKR